MYVVGIFCSDLIKLLENWIDKCLSKISNKNLIIVVWVDRNNIQYAKNLLKDYNSIILEGGTAFPVSIKTNTCIYILRTINILYHKYGAINPNSQLYYIANDIELNEQLNIDNLDKQQIYLLKNGNSYNRIYGGNISVLYNTLRNIHFTQFEEYYNFFAKYDSIKTPIDFDNETLKTYSQDFLILEYNYNEIDTTNIATKLKNISFDNVGDLCTCLVTVITDDYIVLLDNWINNLYKNTKTHNKKILIVWTNLENVDQVHDILSNYKDIEYYVYICDMLQGVDTLMNKQLYVHQTIEILCEIGYSNPKTMLCLFQITAHIEEELKLNDNFNKICFSRYPNLGEKRTLDDLDDYYTVETKNVKKPECGWCYCLRAGFIFGNIKNMHDMLKNVNEWIQDDLIEHCTYPKYHDELYLTRYFNENPEKCMSSNLNVNFYGRENKCTFMKQCNGFNFFDIKHFGDLY